jgi:signal transduction histidine kinase
MNIKDHERQIEIRQYRLAAFSGAFIYPFFGWLSHYLLNVDFDTFRSRLPIGIFSLSVLILSYQSKFVLKYFRLFVLFGSFWAIHDYIGYFIQSNYHFYFSIGLTAMPFIAVICLYYPIDVIAYFVFMFVDGARRIHEFNSIFISVYSILMLIAFTVYLIVFRNRMNLLDIMKDFVEQIELKNKSLTRIGELAAQVAHDNRSPVAALKAVSETMEEADPKKKQLIVKAATRINGIADYLVSEYRTNITADVSAKAVERALYLNEVIQEIIEEKKSILKDSAIIEFKTTEKIKVPDALNLVEFKRVLSNLLNNSVEAFDKEQNKITIELKSIGTSIEIRITDNGKGIPQEYIQKIFDKGVSLGKAQGTGLGLAHAKNYIESIGGSIHIESTAGIGSTVIICITT